MALAHYAKEIVDTWLNAINEQRELTKEEIQYVMNLQDKAILEELGINDGLTEEEYMVEHFSNNRLDYFKDRDGMRR